MARQSLPQGLTEVLAVFAADGRPWTTPEVADQLDVGRRTAYNRLDRLVDHGLLETKKVGSGGRVWWRPAAAATDHDDDADRTVESTHREQQFRTLVETATEYAVFLLDAEGHVRTWNAGAERIKGYEAEEVLGEHCSVFYTDADREAGLPAETLERAARIGTAEDEGWRVRADGSRFWADVTVRPIRDADDELAGYVTVTRDMTDRKRQEAERELQYETTRDIAEADDVETGLEAALRDICELTEWEYGEVWLPTDDGGIRRTPLDHHDDTFEAFAGMSEGHRFDRGEGLPGRVYESGEFEWASDLSAGSTERYPRRERAVEDGLMSALGVPVVADDEVVAVLTFLTSEPKGTDDRLVEIVSSVAADLGDLVVQRRIEGAVARERDLIDQILTASPIGVQVWDRDGGVARMNDRAREFFGLSPEGPDPRSPADLPLYDEAGDPIPPGEHPFDQVRDTGEPVFDRRARIEPADGPERWVTVNAAPVLDADGAVERVVTTIEDVTALEEQARRLERQRDELRAELDEVFERISDGFLALDSEFGVTFVNDHARALLGRESSPFPGSVGRIDAFSEEVTSALREAFDEQRSVRVEERVDSRDAWLEYTVYPSESGLSIYLKDVTDRKEREHELERFAAVTETASDVILSIDDDSRIRTANPAVEETFGYEPAELVGEPLTTLMPDRLTDSHRAGLADYLRTGERTLDWDRVELPGETADGEEIPLAISFSEYEYDGTHHFTGIVRDITDRKERERELQRRERRFRTLVENFPNGAVALVDEELRYTTFGGNPSGESDLDRQDLEGEYLPDVLPSELAEVVVPRYEEALAGRSSQVVTSVGDSVYQFYFLPVRDDDGDAFLALGMSQEITAQKARERALEERIRQQDAIAELGTRALEGLELDALMDEAARLVAETLGTDFCKVLDLDADAEELLLRAGVGWGEGVVGEATVSAVAADSQAAYTLATEEPVIVEDLDAESRFSGPDLLRDNDVRSGISTIIGPVDDPWGILGTHDRARREFTEHDATFVQAVANVLAAAIDRQSYEERLVDQRERLEAINSLHEVVGDVTTAVIEQSTREEIEAAACERLAASESYAFAWTGEVDATTQEVRLRTEAGVEGYLDGMSITVDPDDERSQGPTGRALRTGEVQVANDVVAESQHDPWRDYVSEFAFRSSAAIPIIHEGTVYGALNVYSERANAFTGREGEMIARLGEIIGHAVAAAERKQALQSDELVELDFRVRDALADFGLTAGSAGPITLEKAVPIGDGEFLVYGTASEDDVGLVEALVGNVQFWEEVVVRSEGDPTRFEIRAVDPPVLSIIASRGGSLGRAVIEDGDLRFTVRVAPSVDVRQLTDEIETVYPGVQMLRRRQVSRDADAPRPSGTEPLAELTDRQRSVLETAYHAGFFNWPRDASGEDLAASLDVSPPTVHQHLRKAERKVLESVLGP